MFRPDGESLASLIRTLPCGDELHDRLGQLYDAAGNSQRPGGGQDAYFVVRKPQPLDPADAEQLAGQWLTGLVRIAEKVGNLEIVSVLSQTPSVRVLEGIPPKAPKRDEERSRLMKTVTQACAAMCESISGVDPHAELLRPAYYFVACDPMLRDHLMWPFYRESVGLDDPLASYFELWCHGVKYRIFGEKQIDIYLPRIHQNGPSS
ncbi:hypothetical protein Pla52n_49850 [Stieleria varia]|uniref:Uncharacterized protein n=2 Tax=Stieleria varia TaxID=2528005 RepID=A0A5C6AHC8_9BACT|nr:hypothetical protein Pla52n_49850 [Stieleria varia]